MKHDVYTLTKKDLDALRIHLSKTSTVIAPQETDHGTLAWKEIKDMPNAFYGNTAMSPKEYLFPQDEKLFSFQGKKGKVEIEPINEAVKDITFWGIRPCDLKAIALLDKVFLSGKFIDENYKKKREHTHFIGSFCSEPAETCFCTSLNYDLLDNEVYDMLFFEISENNTLAMCSEKGEVLLKAAGITQEKASAKQLELLDQFIEKFKSEFKIQFTLTKQLEDLKKFFENDAYFEEAAMKCLGCGICTFSCPTCHCFTIVDKACGKEGGCRVRCWDSCMNPKFTLMAGGHNPRTSKAARIRQRFLHKGYYFEETQSELGCVGCGRCLAQCSVSMDICDGLRHVRGEDEEK